MPPGYWVMAPRFKAVPAAPLALTLTPEYPGLSVRLCNAWLDDGAVIPLNDASVPDAVVALLIVACQLLLPPLL